MEFPHQHPSVVHRTILCRGKLRPGRRGQQPTVPGGGSWVWGVAEALGDQGMSEPDPAGCHLPPGVQSQGGAAGAAGAAGAQQGRALATRRQTAKKEARTVSLAAAPAGGPVRRPDREGAQGPGFWVSSRPRGRGRTDHPGKLPGGSGATLNDLHRDAGEGWWSACPSPGFPLPQPLTRGSAPGCAACPFGTSWRGRAASTRSGTDAPFVVPKPAGGGIPQGPTDADVGTAPQADAARGWAAGGCGGRALPASGRDSEPRTCAQALPSGRSDWGAGWSGGCHSLVGRDTGAAMAEARGLHGGAGRAVTHPQPAPQPPRPAPPPPAPALPQLSGGLRDPRSEQAPPLSSNPGTGDPWRRVSASVRTLQAPATPPGRCSAGP